MNEILLRRKNKVSVKTGSLKEFSEKLMSALMADIAQLGYTLSGELLERVGSLEALEIKEFHNYLVKALKKMVGAHVKYTPLFRNFPDDIPDDNEYFFNRIVGFLENVFGFTEGYKVLSCGHAINTEVFDLSNFGACPICQYKVDEKDLDPAKPRLKLEEITPFKIINLGKETDVLEIFRNLVGSKTSISEQDKSDITRIVELYKDAVVEYMPSQIHMKENLAFIASLILDNTSAPEESLKQVFKTSTDILRLAVAMSNGDVSLAVPTKFKSLSNKKRRLILDLLENVKNPEEDMIRWKERWKRLGERIRVRSGEKKYPKVHKALKALRDGEKITTFNGRVEAALLSRDYVLAARLLHKRPGEFARRIDLLIRKSSEDIEIIEKFISIIDSLPTPLLLQLLKHFEERDVKSPIRYFLPKGNICKIQVIEEDNREVISISTISTICLAIEAVLDKRFSELKPLGKVYINPELKNYLVPFSQRSASRALKTIVRGSQIDLPKENTLRAFLYWKASVDLDLSVVMLDENWNNKGHVSYTNMKYSGAVHSGDIQDAPNGAVEFIDIPVDEMRKKGIRYVVATIFSYTGEPFSELEECFAGVMGRSKPKSGEIFEATTVKHKFDLTTDSRLSLPMIIDIKENKMIWSDLSLPGGRFNNVENNSENIRVLGLAMTDIIYRKPNLYQLFKLHASARAESVDFEYDKEKEYDTIFDIDKGITPFDIDEIGAKFL